jgi:hypothetical protein
MRFYIAGALAWMAFPESRELGVCCNLRHVSFTLSPPVDDCVNQMLGS